MTKTYTVKFKDKIYKLEGNRPPTKKDLIRIDEQQKVKERKAAIPETDQIIKGGVINLIPSTLGVAKDIGTAIINPIDTLYDMKDTILGGVNNLAKNAGIESWDEGRRKRYDRQSRQLFKKAREAYDAGDKKTSEKFIMEATEVSNLFDKQTNNASGVYEYFRKKYTTEKGFKDALKDDPASILLDISAILSGGSTLVGKLATLSSKANLLRSKKRKQPKISETDNKFNLQESLVDQNIVTPKRQAVPQRDFSGIFKNASVEGGLRGASNVLNKTANAINPINYGLKAVTGTGSLLAPVVSALTTRGGPGTISTALRSGQKDILNTLNPFSKNEPKFFLDQMRSKSSPAQLVDTARDALRSVVAGKNKDYNTGKVKLAKNETALSFAGIDKALISARDKFSIYRGQIINSEANKVLNTIEKDIITWKKNPELHSAIGMDKLKQKVQSHIESIDPKNKQAVSAGNAVRAEISKTISKQAPEYSKIMKEYSRASDVVKELEVALSLGTKSGVDQAIRKLTSITRNNVNTSFGRRIDLVKLLEDAGGKGLMEEIVGASFQGFKPRGLEGAMSQSIAGLGVGAGAVSGIVSPGLVLTLLATQSPRVIGEILYKLGQVGGVPAKLVTELAKMPKFRNVVAPYLVASESSKEQ
mgnify:FL=1|tara:strand:- start:62 stop:2002 length:1941 start_codon:yes stop_codon:yes gene_type:complete